MKESLRPVFNCQQCGECCNGEGGILVTNLEIALMAKSHQISPDDFRRQYVWLSPSGPALRTDTQGKCILNHQGLCQVHTVKPKICRDWPFLPAILIDGDELELAKSACPGISPDCTQAEFLHWWRQKVS
jgi:hypothetical protein